MAEIGKRVALAYSIEIWINSVKVGFAQTLRPTQRRGTRVVRELNSVNPGIGREQVPEPPEFTFVLTKVVVYDKYQDLLNMIEGTQGVTYSIYDQRHTFNVVRRRFDLVGNERLKTTWTDCLVTDYELGEDKVDGGEIIEQITCTALNCKTEYL